jgi:ABC-type transport system involved in multi-copper enzyme maturation permease subunit
VNAALVRKTLRDCRGQFVLTLFAIMAFEVLFIRAMGEFSKEMSQLWLQQPLVRRMIQMMIGHDLASNLTPTTLMTLGVAHPLIYAFTWSFLITVTTRVLAGEVDRGTADLLLTLPVSRRSVFASVSVVWIALGVPLCYAPLAGMTIGEHFFPLWDRVEIARMWFPATNLLALFIAIGGVAMLCSAVAIRRGIAVGVALGIVLFSLFIVFLNQFWQLPPPVLKISLLHYYRPLVTIRNGQFPTSDVLVLLGIGGTAWLAGLIWFNRRDVPAA